MLKMTVIAMWPTTTCRQKLWDTSIQKGCSVFFILTLQLTQVATKWNYGSEERERGGALTTQEHVSSSLRSRCSLCPSPPPFFHQPTAGGRDETNCVIFIPPSHLSLSLSGRGAHPGSRGSTAPLPLLLSLPHLPSLSHLSFVSPSLFPSKSLYSWSYSPLVLFSFSTLFSHSLFWKRQGA